MRRCSADDPDALSTAAVALDAGEVVALPTDTVYGLAARVDRTSALEQVFALKGRPNDLALPVLVAGSRQLDGLVDRWPEVAARLAAAWWPGPLTLVVPAAAWLGDRLGGVGGTVGVRHPDHDFVVSLCAVAGPLAVTSANRHGRPPCTTAPDVASRLEVAWVVDGGRCDGVPSTVVDCTTEPPTRRREGAIAWSEIEPLVGR